MLKIVFANVSKICALSAVVFIFNGVTKQLKADTGGELIGCGLGTDNLCHGGAFSCGFVTECRNKQTPVQLPGTTKKECCV
jgi:hypothetical protein